MSGAAAARIDRLLTAPTGAPAAFRAELALLGLASLALVPLSLGLGGLWLALLPPACVALALTAVCWARIAPGERRLALVHAAGVLAVCFFCFVALGPRLAGYRTLTVLSGSMRPLYDPGDLIVVTPEPVDALRAGQVVSYRIPVGDHHVITHRVIRVVSSGRRPVVITKGDANGAPDPWRARLEGGPLWRYRFTVPWLGWLIAWLRSPLLRTACVLVLPAAIALLALAQIWQLRLPSLRGRTRARS